MLTSVESAAWLRGYSDGQLGKQMNNLWLSYEIGSLAYARGFQQGIRNPFRRPIVPAPPDAKISKIKSIRGLERFEEDA